MGCPLSTWILRGALGTIWFVSGGAKLEVINWKVTSAFGLVKSHNNQESVSRASGVNERVRQACSTGWPLLDVLIFEDSWRFKKYTPENHQKLSWNLRMVVSERISSSKGPSSGSMSVFRGIFHPRMHQKQRIGSTMFTEPPRQAQPHHNHSVVHMWGLWRMWMVFLPSASSPRGILVAGVRCWSGGHSRLTGYCFWGSSA